MLDCIPRGCEVKNAKYNFERKLAENIKRDSKSFYAYVKGRAEVARSIGPLVNDRNEVVDLAEEMSQEFNKFFSSVFTKERTAEVPQANWVCKDNVMHVVRNRPHLWAKSTKGDSGRSERSSYCCFTQLPICPC